MFLKDLTDKLNPIQAVKRQEDFEEWSPTGGLLAATKFFNEITSNHTVEPNLSLKLDIGHTIPFTFYRSRFEKKIGEVVKNHLNKLFDEDHVWLECSRVELYHVEPNYQERMFAYATLVATIKFKVGSV